jgi:hypothetical protein
MTDYGALQKTFGSIKERKWPVCTPLYHLVGFNDSGLNMFVEGTRLRPKTLKGVYPTFSFLLTIY